MRIFLSYDAKSQRKPALLLAEALSQHGLQVWQDRSQRRNLRRFLQRDPQGEWGLDSWLRTAILSSDFVVGIIPYDRRPDHFPDSWEMEPLQTREELLAVVAHEISELRGSFYGKASNKWDDPHKLDQAAYYLFRPVQTMRMAWYEEHGFPALGKDPFEHWRRWEMRVAGAVKLPVVLVIVVEPAEEEWADFLSEKLEEHPEYVVIRRSTFDADVKNRLIPSIQQVKPEPDSAAATRELKRKLRRLRFVATIRITFWIAKWVLIAGAILGASIYVIHAALKLYATRPIGPRGRPERARYY